MKCSNDTANGVTYHVTPGATAITRDGRRAIHATPRDCCYGTRMATPLLCVHQRYYETHCCYAAALCWRALFDMSREILAWTAIVGDEKMTDITR